MTQIRRAPLHLVEPDPAATRYAGRTVLDTFEHSYGYIEVATELWRLSGDQDRAKDIEAVMQRVFDREVPTLVEADIAQLLANIGGLDAALRGALTDADQLLTPERIEQLRGRSRTLDLDVSRGELARHAVEEAMVGVHVLERALREALDRGAHIVFD